MPAQAEIEPAPAAAGPSAAAPGGGAAGSQTPVMIRAERLGKKFKIYARPWARVTEWLTAGRAVRHEEVWALRDVSFEVRRGESLGVIGKNGSGKSTLLKILSGAMYPTEGAFDVRGRVLSLLELGTGFNPELTGRQNVVNSSRLLAFPPGYAEERMGDIEAFADLPGNYFDRPVRIYSDGMKVRLAFSAFACFEPDVFIVDEALSVGDVFFQQKCAARITEMRSRGTTMLFVSHDLAAVEALCDRVLLLHEGRVRHVGDKAVGIRLYYALSGAGERRPEAETPRRGEQGGDAAQPPRTLTPGHLVTLSLPWQPPDARGRMGDGRVEATGICFRRPDGGAEPVVERNQWLEVYARFVARDDVGPVNLGVTLFDRMNRVLFARGWINADVQPVWLKAGQQVVARFRLRMDLEPGEYILSLAAAQPKPDPASPNGWDQHVGVGPYEELPVAAKVAVLPRSDGRVLNYGPAALASELDYVVQDGGGLAAD